MIDKLVDAWSSVGLLEGLVGERRKEMAMALENQRLFNESMSMGTKFRRMSIPLVRRFLNSIKFTTNLSKDYGQPTDTGIEWKEDMHQGAILRLDLDAETHETIELANKILLFLEERARKHDQFGFKAIGLSSNKIVVFGLGECK